MGRSAHPPSGGPCALQGFHCPPPLGSVAMHCKSSIAHGPKTVWLCKVGAPLPTAHWYGGIALQELHCPLPQAMWQCIVGDALFRQRPPLEQGSPSPQLVGPRIGGVPQPTVPRRCGSAL